MSSKNRWHASKIGLINFWYYDDQEFPFVKGRMLLRGSNGSGKSVTMQSVVPLLLDGNMSPERLDPFGSRDRKMSSYLLEEDDGREERTGYLYLEFKRQETDQYLTIGMGIRARRGKPLDKWYFSLTDGRRIGKDFLLYRDQGEKITLSKKELENRIGAGGQVFDRQVEYMEYVNRQIFGFETVDEYKEMIDLLIQLRTPKLSKDFKPSVINDILGDSLQPLSDDDLRPMSEAIENMDQMTMNLKSRKEARDAAEKIRKVYDKYNRILLYDKANAYCDVLSRMEALNKKEKERQAAETVEQEKIDHLTVLQQELEIKQNAMQKEQESLNKSDAVHLKMRESELLETEKLQENVIAKKNTALQDKEAQYRSVVDKKKQEEDRRFEQEKAIADLLEQMQDDAQSMAFEEHTFFQKELEEHMTEEVSFATHKRQFASTREKIKQALAILQETNLLEPQAEEILKERDQKLRELDSIKKRINECETLVVQEQSAWKEALYQWNGSNTLLKLDQESLKTCSSYADNFDEQSDFAQIRELVADTWIREKNHLEAQLHEKQGILSDKKQQWDAIEEELVEWQNAKDPEPDRTEAVIANRARLDAMHIPYQEFYKVIEFSDELSEDACNRLEEALMQMGILDALVIEEQYRQQALAITPGCEDKYLFVQQSHCDRSLLDVLELNDAVNDIFSNQRLTGILSDIAYGEDAVIGVSPDGVYHMGVLCGTITGEHEAGFLGTRARERNRAQQAKRCREQLQELDGEILALEEQIQELQQEELTLKTEYEQLPADNELRAAWGCMMQAQRAYESKHLECTDLEARLQNLSEKIREKKKHALQLAEQLYLSCSYSVFVEADEAAASYEMQLIKLESAHEMLLRLQQYEKDLTEQMEQIDVDLDDIRYDLAGAKRVLERSREERRSIGEQLKLTDYEQIKERLDACVKWLDEYPGLVKKYAAELAESNEHLRTLKQQKETDEQQKMLLEEKEAWRKECFTSELSLMYVTMPEELETDPVSVVSYLEPNVKNASKESVIQSLNQVYFENRAYLSEQQVMQSELFTDMTERRPNGEADPVRLDFSARYQGVKLPFLQLLGHLEEDIEQLENLIKNGDRELFEDILANTVSRKIRSKINASSAWVEKMNALMTSMNTSSGLKLSLRWRAKTAETENQLDTKDLVELLKKDYRLMSEEEAGRLSMHFRSKVEEARRQASENMGMVSFYQVMKETLDYRKWFEFQLFSQKSGERVKELTNSVFGTFSGGEKAMSMYVPLFSAVVAKYQGGRCDAPRLISLDEAFAGVDNRNIRDMFRLMSEFSFDFIINSQVLWGDCDTLDALAIYQLIRPENAKFVTVMPYLWNGRTKQLLESEEEMEQMC